MRPARGVELGAGVGRGAESGLHGNSDREGHSLRDFAPGDVGGFDVEAVDDCGVDVDNAGVFCGIYGFENDGHLARSSDEEGSFFKDGSGGVDAVNAFGDGAGYGVGFCEDFGSGRAHLELRVNGAEVGGGEVVEAVEYG